MSPRHTLQEEVVIGLVNEGHSLAPAEGELHILPTHIRPVLCQHTAKQTLVSKKAASQQQTDRCTGGACRAVHRQAVTRADSSLQLANHHACHAPSAVWTQHVHKLDASPASALVHQQGAEAALMEM
jgi:hypothetical protein